MEKKTPCECPLSGYCNRHNINKNKVEHRLCSTEIKYFNMWERKKDIEKPVEMPSLIQQATNFTKSTIKHVTTGAKNADMNLQQQRLDICNDCSFYDKENDRCKKCGCFLKVKTKWLSSQCPLKKW